MKPYVQILEKAFKALKSYLQKLGFEIIFATQVEMEEYVAFAQVLIFENLCSEQSMQFFVVLDSAVQTQHIDRATA